MADDGTGMRGRLSEQELDALRERMDTGRLRVADLHRMRRHIDALEAENAALRARVAAADTVVEAWWKFESYMTGEALGGPEHGVPIPLWDAVLLDTVRQAAKAYDAAKEATP